jgi:hypothetical protein
LVDSGIGGGTSCSTLFFAGRGGGAFSPATASRGAVEEELLADNLFIRSASPYFWFIWFADCTPDATCSPCRAWKLFAVEAALRISLSDTDDGSFLRLFAVFRAACFSAHVVPGEEELLAAELVVNLEKCVWSSPAWAPWPDGLPGEGKWVRGGVLGVPLLPMSNPGTAIPALPNRFNAPWLRIPSGAPSSFKLLVALVGNLLVIGGVARAVLGGNLGGRVGGLGFEVELTGEDATSCRAGGLGNLEVSIPVVSGTKGPAARSGVSGSCGAASVIDFGSGTVPGSYRFVLGGGGNSAGSLRT